MITNPDYDPIEAEILDQMLGNWKLTLFNYTEGETLHEEHTRASRSEGYLMAIKTYCDIKGIPTPDHIYYAETFKLRAISK